MEMLAEVISKQSPCLQYLELRGNTFTKTNFETLITKIAEPQVSSSLKVLDLASSANFD